MAIEVYPVIGMSPGNSYFKDEVVKELLQKVVSEYGRTVILIADVPAISTYIALGYPKNRAWRDKALPQGNALRNRVARAMIELGYSDQQVKVVDWKKEIETNSKYLEEYEKVVNLYNSNSAFQKSVDDTTREVLEYADKEITDLEGAVKGATHYLLSEIAFMEFAPEYLNAPKVTYVYHRNWPVYESYIAGKFDGVERSRLGFSIVTTS